MRGRARAATIAAIILSMSAAAGCGAFLGFGSDEEDTVTGADDAASPDGTSSAEGGSTIDADAGAVADASADVDAADVTTGADGKVCVASGSCAKSVFDCCSEMEEPGAAICGGVCGVDICCL